jgi:Fe-S oxidoreductase
MADLRPYRTDLVPNIFTTLREERGITYVDALCDGEDAETGGEDAETFSSGKASIVSPPPLVSTPTLFWPGCSLASYSQELTQAAYAFLHERDLADGLSATCCSDILRYSTNMMRRTAYANTLVALLEARGVRRIITACPNCYRTLQELVQRRGSEVVALSEVLVQAGARITAEMIAPAVSVCVHDSCPDRRQGVFAASVRALFSDDVSIIEKRHHGRHSQCCGLGQLAFVRHPERSERGRQACLEEFEATAADLLVTYCVSCASAFHEPTRTLRSCHYLELLFATPLEWG